MKHILLLFFALLIGQFLHGQTEFTISGYIQDENTGETLIGANVFLKSDQNTGAFSNHYGFYSLSLPPGT